MKVEPFERDIQGGAFCDICGADEPCGNISNCAWWTSGQKPNGDTKLNTIKQSDEGQKR